MENKLNNIQPTKFTHVGEFLDSLPPGELSMVERLRNIIFVALPQCTEKLAYNVPFYYLNSRICYVWPASVPWGGIDTGVTLGFCKGHLLSDEINYLEKRNRKQILSKTFISEQEIAPYLLKSYLFEAKEIDVQLG